MLAIQVFNSISLHWCTSSGMASCNFNCSSLIFTSFSNCTSTIFFFDCLTTRPSFVTLSFVDSSSQTSTSGTSLQVASTTSFNFYPCSSSCSLSLMAWSSYFFSAVRYYSIWMFKCEVHYSHSLRSFLIPWSKSCRTRVGNVSIFILAWSQPFSYWLTLEELKYRDLASIYIILIPNVVSTNIFW